MKISGLFLRSRAGRRIFWTLALAAAVPIALFGWVIDDALREHFAAQAHKQRVQVAKYAGMSTLDNLIVARTVLQIVAGHGGSAEQRSVGGRQHPLRGGAAQIDEQGALRSGDAALWARWREQLQRAGDASGADAPQLLLGAPNADAASTPLLLVARTSDAPGSRWIAEIAPEFIWGDLAPDMLGARVCVIGTRGQTLYCPYPSAANPMPSRVSDGAAGGARWSLFLRSDFGVDDWIFVNLEPVSDLSIDAVALSRTAGLGALATLLIVCMLGLVQVRRTTVPLERLIAGTRGLSQRDYATRVAHESADEFGELARSFNHMAARIGQQFEALEVQTAIDREILNGLDVPRILQQVARRLVQLAPVKQAAVIELDATPRGLARVHRADGPLALVNLVAVGALCKQAEDAQQLQPCADLPPALRAALKWGALQPQVKPVRIGSTLAALIVIGVDGDRALGDEAQRELDELAGRVAVALAAADRERRLIERATRDGLTGLANRDGLLDAVARALESPSPMTLLFVDLDRFKEVNDAMGHQAGDELLRQMARRLLETAPAQALVARPGGDEFVLMLPGERPAAQALVEQMLLRLAEPLSIDGRAVAVAASIGMAHHPDDGRTVSDLLRRADMAMYSAKGRGGNCAAWFETAMDDRQLERSALLAELREALERGEFELHYQPRRQVRDGQVAAAEALLRWRHPQRGLVSPAQFIPLLEETGLIDGVGAWVISAACAQVASWRARKLSLKTVAVNVSARQLQDPLFAEHAAETLRRTGLPPDALEIEVTESLFLGDAGAAIAALRTVRRLGVQIALDDFGTGYSSLSYLQRLPISILKVDRSFVVNLSTSAAAMAVTRSIVALARALELQVVAEGVETEEQAECLANLGCDELQGYLIARPMPAGEIAAFLARTETAPAA